jgi:hypothetical protein
MRKRLKDYAVGVVGLKGKAEGEVEQVKGPCNWMPVRERGPQSSWEPLWMPSAPIASSFIDLQHRKLSKSHWDVGLGPTT